MDDPWGSPWADEHYNNTDAPLKVEVKPVAAVKALLPEKRETPSSPWGQSDDGFGEWNSMPAGVVEVNQGLEYGPSSYTWDVADKETDQGQLEELNGQSITWKYPTARDARHESSKLSPREPSRIVREPSPDPWATKLAGSNIAHVEDVEETDAPDHEVDSDDTLVPEPPSAVVAEQSLSPLNGPNFNGTAVEDKPGEEIIEPMERPDTSGEISELVDHPKVSIQGQEIDHESSGASTSPSV